MPNQSFLHYSGWRTVLKQLRKDFEPIERGQNSELDGFLYVYLPDKVNLRNEIQILLTHTHMISMLSFRQTYFIRFAFLTRLESHGQWILTFDIQLCLESALNRNSSLVLTFSDFQSYKSLYTDGQLFSNFELNPLPSELVFLETYLRNGPEIHSTIQGLMQEQGVSVF